MVDCDLISIIIPTYNRGRLIKRSINSAIQQTYKNTEIIIIDDGSTDNTKEIVKELNIDNVKYYHIDHRGACFARNYGVEKANGKYIAFLDSDDTWDKYKIEKQKHMLEERKCDIVFCSFISNDNGKETIIPSNLNDNKRIYQKDLLAGNFISTQTIFGKKDCFIETKFDNDLKRVQDWELALRLTNKYDVRYQNEVLATQYIQNDSLTKNKKSYVDALKKVLHKHLESFCLDKNGFMNILNEIETTSIEIGNENGYIFDDKKKMLNFEECVQFYEKMQKKKLKVFYPLNNNCGDLLNKILLEKLFNINVEHSNIEDAELYAIGSELGSIKNNEKISYVWGTGFINYDDNVMFDLDKIKVLALRGKLSKKKIEKELNIKLNIVVGDPGLLASKIVDKSNIKKYDVGIIAHFREKTNPFFIELSNKMNNSILIDIQGEVLSTLQKISQCKTIISSNCMD